MTQSSAKSHNLGLSRFWHAVGLFGLLFALYFLTYTGEPIGRDEMWLFDGAHSLLHGREFQLTYTSWLVPTYSTPPGTDPVMSLTIEPMQVYLAVPLVWLAEHIPGIGVLQLAWTLNIITTALTVVALYYYVLTLGYGESTAIVTALLYGIATYAWVYSKMFFREPTFTLFIVLCAYSLERWRQSFEKHTFRPLWVFVALASLMAALLTKASGLLVAPLLIVIILPSTMRRLLNWRFIAVLLLILLGLAALILIFASITQSGKYDQLIERLKNLDLLSLSSALPAYLVSPGFSVWAFAPILVLGFSGAFSWIKKRQFRYAVLPLVFLLSMSLGYSVGQSANWYPGTGWGPRYLLPTLPFLSLWLIPVVDQFIKRQLPRWSAALAMGIAGYSIFVQGLGGFGPYTEFANYLSIADAQIGRTIVAWQDGVWNMLYNPFFIISHQITTPSPAAWAINQTAIIVIPLCLMVAGISLFILTRPAQFPFRLVITTSVVLLVSVMLATYVGLRSYSHDPRFKGSNNDKVWDVVDRLNKEMRSGDAVLLNDSYYALFFMNTYKRPEPLYVFFDAPGERLGFNPQPEIISPFPDWRAHTMSAVTFPRIASVTSRWWFVTEFGPYSQDRYRPTEEYLVRHYFPITELVSDPAIRLLTFAPVQAPPDRVSAWPTNKVAANFGVATLVGFDLPLGNTMKPGTSLPVSLLWTHTSLPVNIPALDYSINLTLLGPDGATAAQFVGAPVGGFAPMSRWVKGGYYRDNHALDLPSTLAPGDYQLWALIYDWSKNTNLPVRNAVNNASADHVLLATIHIHK